MQALEFASSAFRNGGTCSRCGRADRLIDIDVLIDYEGNVAMCTGCIGEAALVAGFLVTERGVAELRAFEKAAAEWEARALEAERLLASVQNAVNRTKNLPKPKTPKPRPAEVDA